MAKQNLFTYSEALDNGAWVKAGCTIGVNVAPNPVTGATTADGIIEDGTLGVHDITQSLTGGAGGIIVRGRLYTYSAFVKPGTRTWAALQWNSFEYQYFNLSGAGSLGSSGNGVQNSAIVALANGWYFIRISGVGPATNSNAILFAASGDGGASYQGVNGQTALLAACQQVVQANWAGDYVQTVAAAVGPSTPPYNMATSENLLVYSQQFQQAIWTKVASVTPTDNSVTAPDGTTTAARIDYSGAGVLGGLRYAQQAAFNTTYSNRLGLNCCKSIWLRADAPLILRLGDNDVFGTTCNVTTAWQRFSYAAPSTPNSWGLYIYGDPADNSASHWYTWGAQLVHANWPGDYVPTTSAASGILTPPFDMVP